MRALIAGLLSAFGPCGYCDAVGVAPGIEVRTVSSRSDSVSGGDVLLQFNFSSRPSDGIRGGDAQARLSASGEFNPSSDRNWHTKLNGRIVLLVFQPTESISDRLLALLSGLEPGNNVLEIREKGGARARVELINHPLIGPIFSGPHQTPFICQTEANGLGAATDSECSANTVIQYYYKSTEPLRVSFLETIAAAFGMNAGGLAPGFKAYDPSAAPPADVAQTVTSDGQAVNYIVRREIGTINRAVYDIRFLHQPGQPLPTPWTRPTSGWNGRLVYLFGGGCRAGYHQGVLSDPHTQPESLLAMGYATATSTLNIFMNDCNDRVSAETLSMVKEHFIKSYGEPVHTIGWGGSGGSMQLHLTAQNYPGLLDGIIPSGSFPDVPTWFQSLADGALLDNAFKASKQPWSEEQKSAVFGFATWRAWEETSLLNPKSCDPSIPKEMIYDPDTDSTGLRCDLYDNEINVFGRNPRTGFANRPLDNVGVQYGLVAFNAGKIDAEQFIELNERVGGYDDNGGIVAARTEADPAAVSLAYRRGIVLTGGGGLPQIPIIDWRQYRDDLADAHVRFQSFVTRARLIASHGSADNQVILVDPRVDWLMDLGNPDLAASDSAKRERDLVRQMDHWLDRIVAAKAAGTSSAILLRTRPADLADSCIATSGERIIEQASYDGPGRCNQLYPSYADPRIAAGGPLTDDILKCKLKPIGPADYAHALTADQLQRLKAVFPLGVCDFRYPGIGQEVTRETWQRF